MSHVAPVPLNARGPKAPVQTCFEMIRGALLMMSLFMASFGVAFAGARGPAVLITEVYGAVGPSGHYQQPLAIFVEAGLREQYLSKRLCAALAEMDKRTPEGDIPNLDFDVVSDSQDPDVHDLRISTENETSEKAVVVANFKSHDDTERTVLRYDLVQEGGAWRINNVEASGKSHWRISDIIAGE
jgi:hypothetical protein